MCSAVEGAGVELIELVCLALSVLRRLLQLSPEGATSSAIASSLSARPASHRDEHLVTVVAQYIYHRHNPQLPSLATNLLTTLSVVSCSALEATYLLWTVSYTSYQLLTFCAKFLFGSTLVIRPNKMGLKCLSVRA